ncbi:hypothetical protein T484DRAFT_1858638 [Baffinella frigidus]|nr:hypothetical protein T484DRAFT_1858638 [Cryptophyta sp. CCMP2293]
MYRVEPYCLRLVALHFAGAKEPIHSARENVEEEEEADDATPDVATELVDGRRSTGDAARVFAALLRRPAGRLPGDEERAGPGDAERREEEEVVRAGDDARSRAPRVGDAAVRDAAEDCLLVLLSRAFSARPRVGDAPPRDAPADFLLLLISRVLSVRPRLVDAGRARPAMRAGEAVRRGGDPSLARGSTGADRCSRIACGCGG